MAANSEVNSLVQEHTVQLWTTGPVEKLGHGNLGFRDYRGGCLLCFMMPKADQRLASFTLRFWNKKMRHYASVFNNKPTMTEFRWLLKQNKASGMQAHDFYTDMNSALLLPPLLTDRQNNKDPKQVWRFHIECWGEKQRSIPSLLRLYKMGWCIIPLPLCLWHIKGDNITKKCVKLKMRTYPQTCTHFNVYSIVSMFLFNNNDSCATPLSFFVHTHLVNKISSGTIEGFYLLILIGCDCGELRLRKGEAVHSFSGQRLDLRQIHPRVVLDDVHAGLVFVHRLKDYLDGKIFLILQVAPE